MSIISPSIPTDTHNLHALFRNLRLQGEQESPSESTSQLPPSPVPINALPASYKNDQTTHADATELDQELRTRMMKVMKVINEVPDVVHSLRMALDYTKDQHFLGGVLEELITRYGGFSLTAVVFDEQGAVCVGEFIRRLKRTQYIDALTEALAPNFYKIMTHPVAKRVVLNCLKLLGTRSNMVFYRQAVIYCVELATDRVGCLALNDCIDTLDRDTRKMLLHVIAENSRSLSHHPYGNYVVQNVLALRDPEVNRKILSNLTDQFIPLSMKREGSHVAERCMQCCPLGAIQVVGEMLKHPDETIVLAGNQFGNYVVQKALAMAKSQRRMNLYWKLVEVLKDGIEELNKSQSGRHVLNGIKNEIHTETD